jgi:hypothetical protein
MLALQVRSQERRDAELRYMRYVMGELAAAATPEEKAAIEAANPRLPVRITNAGLAESGSKADQRHFHVSRSCCPEERRQHCTNKLHATGGSNPRGSTGQQSEP